MKLGSKSDVGGIQSHTLTSMCVGVRGKCINLGVKSCVCVVSRLVSNKTRLSWWRIRGVCRTVGGGLQKNAGKKPMQWRYMGKGERRENSVEEQKPNAKM